jgi:hypothetical protein
MGLMLVPTALGCSAQRSPPRGSAKGGAGNASAVMELAVAYMETYLANAMSFCEGTYYCLPDGQCFSGC